VCFLISNTAVYIMVTSVATALSLNLLKVNVDGPSLELTANFSASNSLETNLNYDGET
jgi:hypothetical protein